MIRLVFLTLSLLYTNFSIGQKYYDSNDLKYYLDFTDKTANLKFLDYKINGPIEEIRTFYGKMFTVIKGDSIHWVLEQSSKKNKYASYLIIKGDYKDIIKLVRNEVSSKKHEVIASDLLMSGYFKDYFNFVDEEEFIRLNRDRLIGGYLKDNGLLGEYSIKILSNNEVKFINLNINGKLIITEKNIIFESNLPILTRIVGNYDYDPNSNIEFLKMGLIYGRIKDESKGIFALNLNKEKKSGSFTIMKVKINSRGNLSSQRNTAIFEISD